MTDERRVIGQSVSERVRPQAEQDNLIDRRYGRKRNGQVFIENYDQAVQETLGAFIEGSNYYLDVPDVCPAPGKPGIQLIFGYPEDVFERKAFPAVVVRRDDISAAMQRWHGPSATQYIVPTTTALPVTATVGRETVTGWDRTEVAYQAEPNDIMYTISIYTRSRQGEANKILRYVLSRFNAYGSLEVKDTLGDVRLYEVFREGIAMLDDVADVSSRVIGFAVTLRVEGELDLKAPDEFRTVSSGVSTNFEVSGVTPSPREVRASSGLSGTATFIINN